MAEIGDMHRFDRKQSLEAMQGYPMFNQSREKNVPSSKSSKHGSPYLCKALFNMMACYLQKTPADEPVFRLLQPQTYGRKALYVYMTAGSNKFL